MEDNKMKSVSKKSFVFIVIVILFLILTSSLMASAENVRDYDESVITGFEPAGYDRTVDTEYKYALITLSKNFPSELSLWKGGKVFYQEDENDNPVLLSVEDYRIETERIEWKCLENYDDELDVFHFVPNLDDHVVAEGLNFPVITVNILGKFNKPPLTYLDDDIVFTFPDWEDARIQKSDLPSYYNGHKSGVLPPVRAQYPFGSCWAFSAIGAIEADMIHDGLADTSIDLSEYHLAYFSNNDFYDEKNLNNGDHIDSSAGQFMDIGGNFLFAGFTLANMLGPVPESIYSYPASADNMYSIESTSGRKGNIQLTDITVIDIDDRDAVKTAILNHGAVGASYYDDDAYYGSTHNSYYNPTNTTANHAVLLVGWDDDHPNTYFKNYTPAGNGAWLVRNSWGYNDSGHNGYFWISYYDASLSEVYAADVQGWRYDNVYSYDNIPMNSYYQDMEGPYFTVSQNFHVDGGELIKAIGFYTINALDKIEFTLADIESSVTKTVNNLAPGYHLITLDAPVLIQNQTDVTVSYRLPDGGTINPCIEVSKIKTDEEFGEIIFTAERGGGIWIDDELYDYDARIKLFTDDLPDLILPANLSVIGDQAFSGGNFKYVKLPDRAISIGFRAFANCQNLKKIYIPSQTTQIDDDAFGEARYLTIEGVPGSVAESYAKSHGFGFKPVS